MIYIFITHRRMRRIYFSSLKLLGELHHDFSFLIHKPRMAVPILSTKGTNKKGASLKKNIAMHAFSMHSSHPWTDEHFLKHLALEISIAACLDTPQTDGS